MWCACVTNHLLIFIKFIFEREREKERLCARAGEGQRERERESQAIFALPGWISPTVNS